MSRIKFNKYNWLAYLYFFFNNVGLAGGLLYTNLLTPFFYLWLLAKRRQPVLYPFFIIVIPFDIIHILYGVEWKPFIISNFLLLSTYIFASCCNYFIHHYNRLESLYKELLILNFIFTLIACVVYFTSFKELLWYKNKFTESVDGFHRLSLLTFEAAYYAQIFAPVALYYFVKIFLQKNTKPAFPTLILVLIPLILSLSIGVIGSIIISFITLYIIHYKKIFYKKNFFNILFFSLALFAVVILILVIFFPNNVLMIRINNIISGVDTSANGRTTDSFEIAWMIAKERSIWFGSGLGQIKVLAYDIVKRYFNYWGDLEVIRIPNAVAETLAIFGVFGLLLRFGLIFYFFFKTKVLQNYYRTLLFVFVFVYQFTGSYITSAVEYVIWVLAFSSAFKQFDVKEKESEQML